MTFVQKLGKAAARGVSSSATSQELPQLINKLKKSVDKLQSGVAHDSLREPLEEIISRYSTDAGKEENKNAQKSYTDSLKNNDTTRSR